GQGGALGSRLQPRTDERWRRTDPPWSDDPPARVARLRAAGRSARRAQRPADSPGDHVGGEPARRVPESTRRPGPPVSLSDPHPAAVVGHRRGIESTQTVELQSSTDRLRQMTDPVYLL